ncbi:phosphatidylglycerophosphatase C [uncultured Cedecea sp.]|uniref:phosphatidylglycerophosphatase C n=1 Tax=uncultured Cedecea sp. TaxID=988762 RepID=UPI00260E5AD3|nr:phosphatidylglycerophosphatase C [uncultured Cedecea sp.]
MIIHRESDLALYHARRLVFFDLDGTLHQQDMFGCYLRYLLRSLPGNFPLVIILLPVVIVGLFLNGRSARWPLSLLLWSITFGRSEQRINRLEKEFARQFRLAVTPFLKVHQRLNGYLEDKKTEVWLVTGTPLVLVKQVYSDTPWFPEVNAIGSQMSRAFGGRVLTLRCLSHEKVVQLEQRLGKPLQFYSGYSDSVLDSPVLNFCQHRFRVTMQGELETLD